MVREAKPDTSAQMKFYHDTADCDFLFGPEIRRYIDDLYRIANELRGFNPEQDAQTQLFFGDQLKPEGIKERFAPYLNLQPPGPARLVVETRVTGVAGFDPAAAPRWEGEL
jgi:hypothetical protein